MHVSAGAGSGKTTQLVKRVVELVRRGTRIDDLVVITFTTAAAGTLRTRLRAAFVAASAEDPHAGFAAALEQLESATICTLHAFAQRILGEFPVEAGLPPGFEVISETHASIDFDAWWNDTLDALLTDPVTARAVEVLDALEVAPRNYREVAAEIHAAYDRFASPPPVPTVPRLDVDPLLDALDIAAGHAVDCTNQEKPTFHELGLLREFAVQLRAVGNDESARFELLIDPPKFPAKPIAKGLFPDSDAVKTAIADAKAAYADVIVGVADPAVGAIVAWLASRALDDAAARRARGRLQFHDLLVGARDLVRDHPEVRHALHGRWRMLLLDEFQDTDPLQIDLAARLAALDPAAAPTSWMDVTLAGGRLFTVGDPKQSIYRFRRADVRLFHEVTHHLPGESPLLSANFRTRPAILTWINAVVGPLFGDDPDGYQAAYGALAPMRTDDPAVDHPVRLIGGEHPKGVKSAAVRRTEAADIVDAVRTCIAEAWPVADDVTGDSRPARLADIAILLPTRAPLPELERAFDDAGIPLRVESQSLVFGTDDVRDLLAVLSAVADPSDQSAIVAALRTPLFACSDDDLARWVEAGGRWRYRVGATPRVGAPASVTAALAALADLHEAGRWRSVDEVLEAVITTRGAFELALARPRPREHWRRVRFLLDKAREFADEGLGGLRAFSRWVGEQIDLETRALEAVVADPDDDAVRILTVHGAKGEEYPVVIVAGLGAGTPGVPPTVMYDDDGAPAARVTAHSSSELPAIASRAFAGAADRDKRANHAERIRLLYVAVTRARDHLVVSTHRTGHGGASTLAGKVAANAHDHAELWAPLPPSEIPPDVTITVAADASPPRTDAEIAAVRARLVAAPRHTVRTTSATAIAKDRHDGSDTTGASGGIPPASDPDAPVLDPASVLASEDSDPADGAGPTWRRGRAGTAIGRAVHAVMQTVDLATGEDLEAMARTQAAAEGVPGLADTVVRAASTLRLAPSVQGALVHPVRREVPVAAEIDGTFVQGFIDLLVEEPDGLVVIDYKTDRAPADVDIDTAVTRYAPQAATYALLLEHVTGRPVVRTVFVFARGRTPVERVIEGEALRTAVERVRADLHARAAS